MISLRIRHCFPPRLGCTREPGKRLIKGLGLLLLSMTLVHCASKRDVTNLAYSNHVHDPVPFVKHLEKGPMQSYLARALPFAPFAELRKKLEFQLSKNLKFRDEAHITVITPVEFERALGKRLKMDEINALAEKLHLQEAAFKPVCIGRGNISVEGKSEETYYVVVNSEKLFQIRSEIQKLFVQKGGKATDFNPELFYPHVTLGFTHRDLHYEEGVVKDERSCIFQLRADEGK